MLWNKEPRVLATRILLSLYLVETSRWQYLWVIPVTSCMEHAHKHWSRNISLQSWKVGILGSPWRFEETTFRNINKFTQLITFAFGKRQTEFELESNLVTGLVLKVNWKENLGTPVSLILQVVSSFSTHVVINKGAQAATLKIVSCWHNSKEF